MKSKLTMLATICCLTLLTAADGFAANPKFFDNAKYNNSTMQNLQADISECKGRAGAYLSSSVEQKSVGRTAVGGAAKGAAAGAIVGSIAGNNAGRSAGAGAVLGGGVSAIRAGKTQGENNPEYQKYATACLEEKGYKVIGWQ